MEDIAILSSENNGTKIGIVVFPGSTCERDVFHVFRNVLRVKADLVWHKNESLDGYDAIVLPGGFSYGDSLRAGIIASFSPIMKEIKKLANEGTPILGVCNGFQILVESGLLPGALMKNNSLKFICKWLKVTVESNRTPFTHLLEPKQEMRIPIAHQEGRYYADPKTIETLENNNQIVLKYQNEDPNGSVSNIAAVSNEQGNVVGMMPHPERAAERILSPFGSDDGVLIFKSLLTYLDTQR